MSTTLTDERKAELAEDYAALKTEITEIDNKYSLSYIAVDLDLPATLGLTHLTYTEKTDAELYDLAEQQIAARYEQKARTLEASYKKSVANINYSVNLKQEEHRKKLAELLSEYQKNVSALSHKLCNAGLLYSSAKTDALAAALADYNAKVTEETTNSDAELAALSTKSDALNAAYQQNVTALASQKSAERSQVIEELAEKEEKSRQSVEKYNQSLDEKEVKYQASCKRALQYAIQAEYERGLEAARLYAELGESGVAQQVRAEKLICCKTYFRTYTQTEANYILSIDSFIESHLETSYSAFTEWISATLSED